MKLKRLVLREEFLVLTKRNASKALLLDYLICLQERADIFWEGVAAESIKDVKTPQGYFSRSVSVLIQDCIFTIAKQTFLNYLAEFKEDGFLLIQKNANPTLPDAYRVDLKKLASILNSMGYALSGYSLESDLVTLSERKPKARKQKPPDVFPQHLDRAKELAKLFTDGYQAAFGMAPLLKDEMKYFINPLTVLLNKADYDLVKRVVKFLYYKKAGKFLCWYGEHYVKTPMQLLSIPRNSKNTTGYSVFEIIVGDLKKFKSAAVTINTDNWEKRLKESQKKED